MNAAGYAKTLRQLGRTVPARMARLAATAITAKLQAGFDAGADPYGNGWAAKKNGEASHLEETGAMRAGVMAVPASGSGLNMLAPSPANYHQSGTSRMVARKVLPDNGVPASWGPILQEAFTDALRESLP